MNLLKQKLDLLGSIVGVLGATLCMVAVVLRFILGPGNPAGVVIAPRNVLLGAIALMVFGCFLKLSAR
jgi:hypothetical protein